MKLPDTSDEGMTKSEMSRGMDDCERIRAGAAPEAGGKRPEDMTPQELHAVLWRVLTFRDRSECFSFFLVNAWRKRGLTDD